MDPTEAAAPESDGASEPGPDPVPKEPGQGEVEPEPGPGSGGSGGGGGEDKDEKVILTAGPTLDNTFPTNPFALPTPGRSSCVLWTNRDMSVAVRVVSMRLEQQEPADDPGLALGDNPRAADQCAPSFLPEAATIVDQCPGAVLAPEQKVACPVEVKSVGSVGTDYTAKLVFRLSATCTNTEGNPCSELVGKAGPTAAKPVEVEWVMTKNYSSCLVERDRSGADFFPEEAKGECPTDKSPASASPSGEGSAQSGDPDAGGTDPSGTDTTTATPEEEASSTPDDDSGQ